MKFMYDNRYRTYGVWHHNKKEVEVSLKELAELAEQIDDDGMLLVITGVDSDGTLHLVRYDANY